MVEIAYGGDAGGLLPATATWRKFSSERSRGWSECFTHRQPSISGGVQDHRAPSGSKSNGPAGRQACPMQPHGACTTECRPYWPAVPRTSASRGPSDTDLTKAAGQGAARRSTAEGMRPVNICARATWPPQTGGRCESGTRLADPGTARAPRVRRSRMAAGSLERSAGTAGPTLDTARQAMSASGHSIVETRPPRSSTEKPLASNISSATPGVAMSLRRRIEPRCCSGA